MYDICDLGYRKGNLVTLESQYKLEIICSNSKSVNAEISRTSSTGLRTCGNTALSPKAKFEFEYHS